MGLNNLSLLDLNTILLVKFCLVIFFVAGLLFLRYKWSPIIFLVITGVLLSISYAVFVNDLGLTFWGLRGDEVTITAMYEMFAHGSFGSDFAFPNLPPFYPPLFFWFFAVPGRLFDWNGVQMDKVSVATTFLIFPVLVYFVQAWYWKYFKSNSGKFLLPGKIAWLITPFLIFIFTDWDAFILKPYEVLAAIVAVLWVTFLLNDLHHEIMNKKRIFLYALTGGLIFMLYYLWLIFGAIAVALSGLFVPKDKQGKFYLNLFFVGVLTLLFASPYLVPLISVYHKFGTENWPVAFMTMKGIIFPALMVQWFNWRGILFLIGLFCLLFYRKNVYIRSLLLLFVSGYVWLAMGWFNILFFKAPLQEFKPFDFFHFTIISLALAYGVEQLYLYIKSKYPQHNWGFVLGVIGLFFVANYMFFGAFIDDPVVQQRREESVAVRGTVKELIDFLHLNLNRTLSYRSITPGAGEIYAFVPVNNYIYFNQANNHPATRFSEKKMMLELLMQSKDKNAFYQSSQNIPFGPIQRFVLFKNSAEDYYSFYFHVDKFPRGAGDERIDIPKSLLSEPYFTEVFSNSEFVVWDVNENYNLPQE